MSWFGLVDDSIDLDTFFRQYYAALANLINSFNKTGFPEETFARIIALLNLKANSKNVIVRGQDMRTDFQDFLIDMEATLNNFNVALRTGNLAIAVQRKDFVSANNERQKLFSKVKRDFIDSALANLKSFQTVLYLLGP